MHESVPLRNGGHATVDVADLDRIAAHRWSRSPAGYAYAYVGGRQVLMHRLILGDAATGLEVHHTNGDSLDNRRANLETMTKAEHSRREKPRVRETDEAKVTISRETRWCARRLAAHLGVPLKEAIRIALEEALAREKINFPPPTATP